MGTRPWPMSWLYRREGERLLAYERQIAAAAHSTFLVTEKVLYARAKNLSGIYVMPDGSFNYDDIDLK